MKSRILFRLRGNLYNERGFCRRLWLETWKLLVFSGYPESESRTGT
jgi:hypothetical protein